MNCYLTCDFSLWTLYLLLTCNFTHKKNFLFLWHESFDPLNPFLVSCHQFVPVRFACVISKEPTACFDFSHLKQTSYIRPARSLSPLPVMGLKTRPLSIPFQSCSEISGSPFAAYGYRPARSDLSDHRPMCQTQRRGLGCVLASPTETRPFNECHVNLCHLPFLCP